jgi:hypothetical protein
MGRLPTLLVRSSSFVMAALFVACPAGAQLPISTPGGAETETESATPAEPEAADTQAAIAPIPVPATTSAPPRAETHGDTGQPVPAKADRLKQASTPREEPDEYFEDDAGSTERPRRSWYGWQTLIADGISTTVFFTALSEDDRGGQDTAEALAWAGILGYEIAPAIVHFAHRNPGRGFASMGIRLGMPLAGAFLGGAAASGCHGTDCKAAAAGVGFLLGMGGAIAIDAALLAFDYRESTARSARRTILAPLLSLSPQHAFVGLQGEL